MNGLFVSVAAIFALSTATASSATEVVPAWQEPGFVMEEIVVTAVRPAWQHAGFIMEEVVVTATAEDVANAWRERLHRRARMLVTHVARPDLPE